MGSYNLSWLINNPAWSLGRCSMGINGEDCKMLAIFKKKQTGFKPVCFIMEKD
jgi:hypothetical protein